MEGWLEKVMDFVVVIDQGPSFCLLLCYFPH